MTILKGKLTTESGTPFTTLLFNPTLLQLDGQNVGTGQYLFTSDTPIFNSDLPPKWYIANNQGLKYAVSQTSRTEFAVSVYDNDGTESNMDLSGVEFEIDL